MSTLLWVLTVFMLWLLASLPLGVLVGKCISLGDRESDSK